MRTTLVVLTWGFLAAAVPQLKPDPPKLPPSAWDSGMGKQNRSAIPLLTAETRRSIESPATPREIADAIVDAALTAGYQDITGQIDSPLAHVNTGERYLVREPGRASAMVFLGRLPVRDGVRVMAIGLEVPSARARFVAFPPSGRIEPESDVLALCGEAPLTLRGEVARRDGTVVRVAIGGREGDPLLRLSAARSLDEQVRAMDEYTTRVLAIFHDRFSVEPGDLEGAALELVPAVSPAGEGTLESPFLSAWGLGSRSVAVLASRTLLSLAVPGQSVILLLEEGRCAADDRSAAQFVKALVGRLLVLQGQMPDENLLRTTLSRSVALVAADVDACVPVGPGDERPWLGFGPGLGRLEGSPLAVLAALRKPLEEALIPWQAMEPASEPFAQSFAELGMSALLLGLPTDSRGGGIQIQSGVDILLVRNALGLFCSQP